MNRVGHLTLIPIDEVVYKGDPADPVPVPDVSKSLKIILLTGKVPHKVSQEHPVILILDKIFDIICHGRLLTLIQTRKLLIGIDLSAVITIIPHAGEDMRRRGIVPILTNLIAGYFVLGLSLNIKRISIDARRAVGEIRAIDDRPISVLV